MNLDELYLLVRNSVFNKNYYNHTSFYRALQLPEQARNIQVMLEIPFGK